MTAHSNAPSPLGKLLEFRNGFIIHHAVCAVAKLGVADLVESGIQDVGQLARALDVHEEALYRTMRALASRGVFEETEARRFKNSEFSAFLRRDVPGSIRPAFVYFGTEFFHRPFGELLHTIRSGEPAAKLFRTSHWDYMQANPEVAGIFDDAMTAMSTLQAAAVASAYDFGQWDSVMDVGGGNGILLSHILKRHGNLRGVLADQPDVLERARRRGFLDGDVAERATMQECDFFREVPSGCRAYVMKSVIHDWDDERAGAILSNCRRVVPSNGALLLVEWLLSGPNTPSPGTMTDLIMLVLLGGKERTEQQYRELLSRSGFRLDRVIPTEAELAVFEARTA